MVIKKEDNFYKAYLDNNTIYGGNFVKKLYNAFDSDYNDNFNYEYILDDECKDYDKLVKRNNILFYISKNIYKVNSTKYSRNKYIENFYKNVDDFTSIFDYNNNKNIILFKFLFIYTYIILFWSNYYTTNYSTFKNKKKIEFKNLYNEFYKSNNNIFNSLEKEYKRKNDFRYYRRDEQFFKKQKETIINELDTLKDNIKRKKSDNSHNDITIFLDKLYNIINNAKIKSDIDDLEINDLEINDLEINDYDLKNIEKYLNRTINKYNDVVDISDNIISIDKKSDNKYSINFNIKKIYYLNDNKIYNNDLFLNNIKYYEYQDNYKENINFINIFYKYIIFICTNKYINDNTKININNISKYNDFINYDNLKTETDICKFKNYKKNVINKSIKYFIYIFNKIKDKEKKKEIYEYIKGDFKLYNINIDKFLEYGIKNYKNYKDTKQQDTEQQDTKQQDTEQQDTEQQSKYPNYYIYIYKILIIDYYIEYYIYKRYNYYNNNIIDSKYIKNSI